MPLTSFAPLSPGSLKDYVGNITLLEEVFQSLPEMVQIIDAKTIKALYANRSLLNLLGYTQDEVNSMGTTWPHAVIHPDDYPLLTNHLKNLVNLHPGERSRIVYSAKDAQGYWRKIESINQLLTVDEHGKTDRAIGFTKDISTSLMKSESVPSRSDKQEHDTLEHRCKNCRKLLGVENIVSSKIDVKCTRCGEINLLPHASLDAIFSDVEGIVSITDAEYRLLYVNKRSIEQTGFTQAELLGGVAKAWGGQRTDSFYADLNRKLTEGKKPILVEIENKKKTGELYRSNLQISPILDTAGNIQYIVGIEKVITSL